MINGPEDRDQVIDNINQHAGPLVARFMTSFEALSRGAEMTTTLVSRVKEIPMPDERVFISALAVAAMYLPLGLIKAKDLAIDILIALDGGRQH